MEQERLRVLGQMASGIAHDINNALSPVALYTESLLEREANLSPRTRAYLETTQRAIGDVSHTVGRMREFCRKREPQLVLMPVDLNVLWSGRYAGSHARALERHAAAAGHRDSHAHGTGAGPAPGFRNRK